ncbi:energy-coupling factor ABC transporter ATP-binding protein [Moorella sulfitireducens]|uniref:energy-coupling factor ABC transporter ATP-binding protein n=1 Tax=Neomoorella sulfitireducens TaxID=2972948 RepID=UPI0021AD152E|nr:ATP-binding cassette domain-containing protein [Moorella sulfitireducens]
MIEVKDLRHVYPGGVEALKGVSLTIEKGEFLAIIGQNGAGKTTLCKHFNGLLRATSGQVLVDGMDAARTKIAVLARKVGHVFQNPDHQIFCDSVWEEVAFGPKNIGLKGQELEEAITSSLEAVDLLSFKDRHPYSLSKGQRQRLALASVLATKPEILVIDEPTTGQDYNQARQIMEIVRQIHLTGRTIIMVTHDMDIVAEYCHRVIVMTQGRIIIDGPTATVMSNFDVLRETHLNPPQITLIGKKLGFEKPFLTIDEAFAEIEKKHAGKFNYKKAI